MARGKGGWELVEGGQSRRNGDIYNSVSNKNKEKTHIFIVLQIWTYTYTHDTITIIKELSTSIISENFFLFFCMTLVGNDSYY